ncbi:hypothetical protein ACGFMO_22550 [Streptomyces niveus]|uniref:hypothetical protein n=1 Tax=Streptomyces niveus TaxID=193462 RepID=UPI00371C5158
MREFLTGALPFATAGYPVELVVLAVREADSLGITLVALTGGGGRDLSDGRATERIRAWTTNREGVRPLRRPARHRLRRQAAADLKTVENLTTPTGCAKSCECSEPNASRAKGRWCPDAPVGRWC